MLSGDTQYVDPFEPDTIEPSPLPHAHKRRHDPSPLSNSDDSGNGDGDVHVEGMHASRKKKRTACGVLVPKRGDDADALRGYVVKQREYQVLSESLSEACESNSKEGFAKAVLSMIVEVGLKLDGRGLQILFEEGKMSDFCHTIAQLNRSHPTTVKRSKMKMVRKWKKQANHSEYFRCETGKPLRECNIMLTVKGKHNLLMHIDTDEASDDLSHKIETICRNEASDVLTKLLNFSRALQSQVQTAQECLVTKKQVREEATEQFRQQKKIMCERDGTTDKKAENQLRGATVFLYAGLFPQKTAPDGTLMFRKDGKTPVTYTAGEMAQEATGKSKSQIYKKGLTEMANEPVNHALLLQRSAMTWRMSAFGQDYLTAAKEVGASGGIDLMALCGLDKHNPDSRRQLALLSFDPVTGIDHFGKQQHHHRQQQQHQLMLE